MVENMNSEVGWFTLFLVLVACLSFAYQKRTSYRTVPSEIWQIFSKFVISCSLLQEPSGEWNKTKVWETREIFVIITWDYRALTSLSLAQKYIIFGIARVTLNNTKFSNQVIEWYWYLANNKASFTDNW